MCTAVKKEEELKERKGREREKRKRERQKMHEKREGRMYKCDQTK